MSIEDLLARGHAEVWRPAIVGISQHLAQAERDVELVLTTMLTTVMIVWLLGNLFGSGKSKSSPTCCVTKFFEQRRAKRSGIVTIPSGTGGGGDQADNNAVVSFLQELYNQLGSIQKEISILKHERELMDAELIETSTQILQTLGASFIGAMPGDESLISRDGSLGNTPDSMTRRKIELPTPLMHQPKIVRPEPVHPAQPRSPKAAPTNLAPSIPKSPKGAGVPVVKGPQPKSPIAAHATTSTAVAAPKAFPKSDNSPVSAPVHVPPKPAPPQPRAYSPEIPPSATVPAMPKAEPKMSALAAARLKREAEMNAAKATPTATAPQPSLAATNPFAAKAKPGASATGQEV